MELLTNVISTILDMKNDDRARKEIFEKYFEEFA